jgi:hypothetical protein
MHALRLAVETSETIAAAGIEVDAKDGSARAFYTRYGFKSLPDDALHMYLAMATAKMLFPRYGPGEATARKACEC